MKRILFAVLLMALAGGSLAGGAVVTTVKTASVADLGKVVVSASGRTLYHLTAESKGKVACSAACLKQWPPLLVKAGAKPVGGAGVATSKLGVLKRPDGTFQVTYGGFGLYLYAGDSKAGQANGEAVEDSWYAVSPAARVVKQPASASSGGGMGSGYTSTTGSTGPGYDPSY